MKKLLYLLTLLSVSFPAIANDYIPTIRVETNLGEGCHIAATLPKGERSRMGGLLQQRLGGFRVEPLPASWKSNMGEMYFSLRCLDVNDPDVSGPRVPIKYDPVSDHWVKDMSEWIAKAKQLPDKYDREFELADINARDAFEVNAVNSKGWVMTQKDITGEENGRRHSLMFCLVRPPKALCGDGVTGYLIDPKSDLTKRALEIIRTIEFLPDVPAVGQ
ncbi:hypothetical protein FNL37_1419 [Methylovorus glucosotrophus]|uniref:hypothetical protein n=1 Tax=Methylovorus glucosotrophus TaxID=266009 RepID=UPI0013311E77|nr:hypothetical protein [Methylovorus glucosotrophus]KAF0843984.1 hypothetical protein FNL37_1419 [Methylovorus glucosotrophus]